MGKIADKINSMPKYVASTALDKATSRRRREFAILIALWIVLAGCSSGSSDTASDTATRSPGQASASVDQAIATLCATLDELEGSLETVSEQGIAQGDEIVSDLNALARALETAAAVLETADANDAANRANSLAADLEAITADPGEDARAGAAEAADKLEDLSTEVERSGS